MKNNLGKKQAISLSIPTPCMENWEKMTANEKGRHCSLCNKTVIDFSLYTDKELFEFFKNVNGSVCGRLNNYQVSNTIVVTEQNNRTFFHKLFFGTALASWLGIATNASAQDAKTPAPTHLEPNGSKLNAETKNQNSVQTEFYYVKGKVTDFRMNQSIAFANVVLSSPTHEPLDSAVTDVDGKFRIRIPTIYRDKKLYISCAYVGYEKKEIMFEGNTAAIDLNLTLNAVFMGDISVQPKNKEITPRPSNPDETIYNKDDIQHMPH